MLDTFLKVSGLLWLHAVYILQYNKFSFDTVGHEDQEVKPIVNEILMELF